MFWEQILDKLLEVLGKIIELIPSIVGALIIIGIGYAIGEAAGRAVNYLIEKTGIEKGFDQTEAGKSFRKAGLDLSSFVAGLIKAFIIVLSVIVALQVLNISGPIGEFLIAIANYLPRLLGGIIIIVFGTILVDFLTTFISRILKPVFPKAKSEVVDMLRNLLLVGLIAVVLFIALDLMQLAGEIVYPLILGFVIIGAGIALTDGLIKSITDEHKEFIAVAGYAKFILYSVFLIVGIAAIFSTFPGVSQVVANIAWGFAIAIALMLVPVMYSLAKQLTLEATRK